MSAFNTSEQCVLRSCVALRREQRLSSLIARLDQVLVSDTASMGAVAVVLPLAARGRRCRQSDLVPAHEAQSARDDERLTELAAVGVEPDLLEQVLEPVQLHLRDVEVKRREQVERPERQLPDLGRREVDDGQGRQARHAAGSVGQSWRQRRRSLCLAGLENAVPVGVGGREQPVLPRGSVALRLLLLALHRARLEEHVDRAFDAAVLPREFRVALCKVQARERQLDPTVRSVSGRAQCLNSAHSPSTATNEMKRQYRSTSKRRSMLVTSSTAPNVSMSRKSAVAAAAAAACPSGALSGASGE
ncbi:hypothetical protein PybrP1_001385 [[Pythium] brassicae (nom. inval.)]|nr:hypothetical protein PybrP1_001385 [[Pythium] brassicae (nom. inval.)]